MRVYRGGRSVGAALSVATLLCAALLVSCASGAGLSRGESHPASATTVPHPEPIPTRLTPQQQREADARAWVSAATLRQLAGSVIMSSVPSANPAEVRALMTQAELGGFILMRANIPGSPEELRGLTEALIVDSLMPPLVAIDEEGGDVVRLPWDGYLGADDLRFLPAEETFSAFSSRAELLADVGVNVNFGVVADVTADPASFIYWRTLGDDAGSAADRVRAAVLAEGDLVASTLKHFPGHGVTAEDSHFAIPTTEISPAAWLADPAIPFRTGIDAGAELLMFAHLAFVSVSPAPTSLAPEWYAIAREELGFEGVAITDDLSMLTASGIPEYQDVGSIAVAALVAGADMALMVAGMDHDAVVAIVDRVVAAAESGELPRARLEEAALRVAELRLRLAE